MLDVRGLTTTFETEDGLVRAVEDVSFHVEAAKTLGIVGESGCGKSVTALSIMRLLPEGVGRIAQGSIVFRDRDLVGLREREMRDVRGNDISMIFQEPMTSLNPVYTVGAQVVEAISLHQKVTRAQSKERAVDMLRLVGIHSPEENFHAYPHQLSGGMRQRVMIAMALACEPQLLIADEPTTALDVTIQAQILELLKGLQEKLGMGIVLITHDLGVVAEYTHHVVVMYAGKVVESASVRDLFRAPRHPYTRGLLESLPRRGKSAGPSSTRRARLRTIEGLVPDLRNLPPGCRFADRCPLVAPECREKEPELVAPAGEPERLTRCYRSADVTPEVTP
jgi:oligopeptide/dipeptide ABC transporter ATP-binding protein